MMKICLLTFLGSVLLSFSTAAQIYQKSEEPEQVSGNGSSSICCYFDEPSKTAISRKMFWQRLTFRLCHHTRRSMARRREVCREKN